jgi:predicted acetyltransferase
LAASAATAYNTATYFLRTKTMPVTLERIDCSKQQDLIDLEKVYNDYPTELRWVDLQQKLANNTQLRLYAGRFNDRLLGAITVEQQGNALILDHLCVRKITRQRHVARDILRLLLQTEKAKQYKLTPCVESEGLDKLLNNAGFVRNQDTYIFVES